MRATSVLLERDPWRRLAHASNRTTLRGLEGDGLVRRTVFPEVPVRVEYALTDAGRTPSEPLRALQDWAAEHLGDVSASQQAHDGVRDS